MQQITTHRASVVGAKNDEAVSSESGRGLRGNFAAWFGGAIVIAAVIAPIALQRYLTFDPALVLTFGYAAVFLMGVLGSITFFIPVPTLGLVFAGSTMLNPVLLAIAAAAGITLGMAGCYALGKAGTRFAERSQPDPGTKMHRATVRMADWYKRNVATTSFFMAALPNPAFDYAGYLAGLTGVSQTRFLVATFVGKVVQSLAVALLGYYAFEQISRVW